MILGQPMLSAMECNRTAQQDLRKLLKTAPAECQEPLRQYYCQLIQDVQRFNTCANLTDGQGLQYFECVSRPVHGQHNVPKPFVSQCSLDGPVAGSKRGKGLKKFPYLQLEATTADVRIAFFIVAHRAAGNVERLLQRIYCSSHVYLIHVDLKAPAAKVQLDSFLKDSKMERAQTFSEVNATKGGNDLLRISMLGLRRLLKLRPRGEVPWHFFVKLSEFDYPVAPRHALEQFLWLHKGLNFVGLDSCFTSTCSRHLGTACAGATYSFISALKMHKPLSFGMRFARGSEWVALTYSFAKYLVAEVDKPSSASHEIWNDALLLYQPDEVFFQTAILNSPFCQRHVNTILHYIPKVLHEREAHGTADEIGTRSPAVFSQEDLTLFSHAGLHQPRFFARKFLDTTDEPASKLRHQLDEMTQDRKLHNTSIHWDGLVSWLGSNLAKWVNIAGLSNSTCERGGAGTDTCRMPVHVQVAGRLGAGMCGKKGLFSRWLPETWVVQGEGAVFALAEKFAVPLSEAESASPPSTRAMGVSFLAARVGTGFVKEHGKFEGHVSVIPVSSCASRDVRLATYWALHAPHREDLEVVVEWLAPGGARCGHSVGKLWQESRLGGLPVAVTFPRGCADVAKSGTWTCRIRVRDLTSQFVEAPVASREFVVFDSFEDVSLVHMHRFFSLRAFHMPQTCREENGPAHVNHSLHATRARSKSEPC